MRIVTLLALLVATPAFAQMQSRPTDPPVVDAVSESWYRLREPIQIGSDVYYPAGAAVFFNGNVMVRTGHYNGVPVYSDATLEPYSVVFVPIGRGLLQPYERPRRGGLSGTAGSRLSAFPIRLDGDRGAAMTATAPTQLPVTGGAIAVFTPEPLALSPLPGPVVEPVAALSAPAQAFVARVILTPARPENNDGLWVQYNSQRWVSAGRAETRTAAFTQIGDHRGFPVLRRPDAPADVIYLPTRDGLVAPYRRKG